jgi:hypothetical protein
MRFRAAEAAYERWMRERIPVVEADLAAKATKMRGTPFAFLRATCFRFAHEAPRALPELVALSRVPSIGDAHLENFGVWRDAEGRLAWGVNDLDEAALLPWPMDLVRLATSARLEPGVAAQGARHVCARLLEGYVARLGNPRPFVLDRENEALRDLAAPTPRERRKFWDKLERAEPAEPPADMRDALLAAFAETPAAPRFAARQAGLGSLGRPRFVALAEWRGGPVAREAKRRLPSCWTREGFAGADVPAMLAAPGHAPDPWLRVTEALVIRRLAPDSRKLEPEPALLSPLLEAMGGEVANVHSQGDTARLRAELARLPAGWLAEAAHAMARLVEADFSE